MDKLVRGIKMRWLSARWRAACVWEFLTGPDLAESRMIAAEAERIEAAKKAEEYARGYMSGWRECYQTTMRALDEVQENSENEWQAAAAIVPGTRQN